VGAAAALRHENESDRTGRCRRSWSYRIGPPGFSSPGSTKWPGGCGSTLGPEAQRVIEPAVGLRRSTKTDGHRQSDDRANPYETGGAAGKESRHPDQRHRRDGTTTATPWPRPGHGRLKKRRLRRKPDAISEGIEAGKAAVASIAAQAKDVETQGGDRPGRSHLSGDTAIGEILPTPSDKVGATASCRSRGQPPSDRARVQRRLQFAKG